MPTTQEEVDTFFVDFANEMKDEGYFILDNLVHVWPNLPTIDDIREQQLENQCDEDEDDENELYD